ncbi:hypothetical protein LIER_31585 [Lithospermum erythrorhizon]|uniref:Reverse transcriptase domain-containing protein n=1 Tax=Lithospermum erythrorhizon TaxID=34254 RepID=A0AAV3RSF2_LITER
MAIKLELDKAFNRVDWGCVRHCLKHFGFPECISNIILHCISSTQMVVITNGKVGKSFKPSRGVRQGDYISPYIFIIIMKLFHLQIDEAPRQGTWKPLNFGRSGHSISHCFFADDIILFGKADMEIARTIDFILKKFSKTHSIIFYQCKKLKQRVGALFKGLKSTIGDGTTTFLWTDNWLGQGCIANYMHGPLNKEEHNAKVCSIIHPTTKLWDLSRLSFQPPMELANRILATPTSLFANIGDSFTSKDRSFLMKEAYGMISMDDTPNSNLDWLWKLKTLPRIKTFLWLACLNKLPTRLSLFTKNITKDGVCCSCFTKESCNHLIWE